MHLLLDVMVVQSQMKVNPNQIREGWRKVVIMPKDPLMLTLHCQVIAPSICYFQNNSF